MMLDISGARAELTDALTTATGLHVHQTLPERLAPPLIYLREGEPFIAPEEDGPYGAYTVQFVADIVERPAAINNAMIAAADGHVADVLDLTNRYNVAVGGYASSNVGGQEYLIAPITITFTIS